MKIVLKIDRFQAEQAEKQKDFVRELITFIKKEIKKYSQDSIAIIYNNEQLPEYLMPIEINDVNFYPCEMDIEGLPVALAGGDTQTRNRFHNAIEQFLADGQPL
jgi:hypothetical protein